MKDKYIPAEKVQETCKDCGHIKDDSRFHLDAPGTNWGAALHSFVPRQSTPAEPAATDLKLCPFCGLQPEIAEDHRCFDTGPGYRVRCASCHGETCWWHTLEQAKLAWNKRPAEPAAKLKDSAERWDVEKWIREYNPTGRFDVSGGFVNWQEAVRAACISCELSIAAHWVELADKLAVKQYGRDSEVVRAAVAACSAEKDREIAELERKLSDLEGIDKVCDTEREHIILLQKDLDAAADRIKALEEALRPLLCDEYTEWMRRGDVRKAHAALADAGEKPKP